MKSIKQFGCYILIVFIFALLWCIININQNGKVLQDAIKPRWTTSNLSPSTHNLEATGTNWASPSNPSRVSRDTDPDSFLASRIYMNDHAYWTRSDNRVRHGNQTKFILVYNRPSWYFSDDRLYEQAFNDCEGVRCNMTDDKSLSGQADAVMVHVCEGNVHSPTQPRPPYQIWVAYSAEAPPFCSAFLGNWRGIFNWTMHYRTDADIFKPYGVFFTQGENEDKNYTEIIQAKTKGVAWFVSNCHPRSGRDKYVRELQKYIEVDVFGRCGPLTCGDRCTDMLKLGRNGLLKCKDRCMAMLNVSYYFYLAFENSHCQDYVTEKLFKVYRNINVIPVVRGGADYSRYFPKGTYINTADFSSPQSLAESLKDLMADQGKFAEMLRVKDRFKVRGSAFMKSHCQLCRKLHQPDHKTKVYQDISGWVLNWSKCWSPNDI